MILDVTREALSWAAIGVEAIGVGLVPAVLLRRKEPASTFAWIMVLLFLPAVGTVLFWAFGRDRVRYPVQKKRRQDARVRASIAHEAADGAAQALATSPAEGFAELERALFHVAARLTHTRPRGGNKVDVFSDGNLAYDALGAAIDGAKEHVHAEYYLIRDDATGRWFRDRLAAAAARGVEVRLLCDGFGCLPLGARWFSALVAAGGQVAQFLPFSSMLFQPMNLRNHRKIVVVDGRLAFTGGLNVGDEYRGQMAGIGQWRDVHLRIEGPAARELQRIFFEDWGFARGETPRASRYFPDEAATTAGDATIAIVPSGPDTATQAIHRVFFGAIVGAQDRVRISTPYFVPDEALTTALELAAYRGVSVQIILPAHSNHLVTFHAGRSFYDELIDAGVEIYEFLPGIVHAKVMSVDGAVCLVGSANMDLRSFRLNFEVHALIHDAATARALEVAFDDQLASCRRVLLGEWRKRPLRLRLYEGASRLVSPLL